MHCTHVQPSPVVSSYVWITDMSLTVLARAQIRRCCSRCRCQTWATACLNVTLRNQKPQVWTRHLGVRFRVSLARLTMEQMLF